MGAQNKHVVFDVVGTLVSYDAFREAFEERFDERIRTHHMNSSLFTLAWMEGVEKEYTYLSMSKGYTKVFDLMAPMFYRTLLQTGIRDPHAFASKEDLDYVLGAYRKLRPRPGAKECIQILRDGGFTVWCLTSGDTSRVAAYLANGGIDFPPENFVSCDSIGIGKPAPASYQFIYDKFPKENLEAWFAAAHMWDSSAARRFGFKAAWCSAHEKDPMEEIYGKMDVMADDLPSMARGIVTSSSS